MKNVIRIGTILIAIGLMTPLLGLSPNDGIAKFGRIPVLHNGRIKPLDSVARNSLILIREKQSFRYQGRMMSATEWMLNVIAKPDQADALPVFVLHNPDLKMFLGFENPKKKYFSFNDFKGQFEHLEKEAKKFQNIDSRLRSAYQKSLIQLNERLITYYRIENTFVPASVRGDIGKYLSEYKDLTKKGNNIYSQHIQSGTLSDQDREFLRKLNFFVRRNSFVHQMSIMGMLPPEREGVDKFHWHSFGNGLMNILQEGKTHALIELYAETLGSFRRGDQTGFEKNTDKILSFHRNYSPSFSTKTTLEDKFNAFKPFYKSIILYILSFILIVLSWLFWEKILISMGYHLFGLALAIHSFGLATRMYLQGRPPVTNLYSSAIFVGWIAILMGVYLEKLFKNRIGVFVASLIGFVTLIIAHHLSLQGDTLEMMQAVLDSNFWLATHVVTVTMGYSATFLAGALGIVYFVLAICSRKFGRKNRQEFFKMVYGVISFGLFFSFIGTVLGGIWADQSWGRFWGWDPKENGALLIVLWNTIILHAVKNENVGERGLMVMAVFGNIITSFSWFGVNMLGVGLHSYGFMDEALLWLIIFMISQITIITIGCLPIKRLKNKT